MAGRTFGLLLRTADYKGGGILKSCLSEFTLSAVRLSLYRMRPIKEETFIGRTLLDLTHCKSEGIKRLLLLADGLDTLANAFGYFQEHIARLTGVNQLFTLFIFFIGILLRFLESEK